MIGLSMDGEMREHIENIKLGYNCSFGFRKDGEWKLFPHLVCHAPVTGGGNQGFDQLFNCWVSPAAEWHDFMLDPEKSPWRSIIPDVITERGHGWTNAKELPKNILFNFLISSRFPVEYPAQYDLWRRLVVEGFDPALTFYYVSNLQGSNFPVSAHLGTQHHAAQEVHLESLQYVSDFVLGVPHPEDEWKGVSAWGPTGLYRVWDLLPKGLVEKETSTSQFIQNAGYELHKILSLNKLRELLTLETKRIFENGA